MRPRHRHATRGFTLIELMVTVAIVAILAAVALPSYRDYVMRGYLVNATTVLAATQAQMERYYQDNRKYTSVDANVYAPCDETYAPLTMRTQGTAPGAFVVTCHADLVLTPPSYKLTATGVSGSPVGGFVYTVDVLNNRTTTINSTPGWNGTYTCWVTKKGQTC